MLEISQFFSMARQFIVGQDLLMV